MSITHLSLSSNSIGRYGLKNLGDNLRDSKLIDLDLSHHMLDDRNVDTLCLALNGTKITTLKLASNYIKGYNDLGNVLSETQIASLDLGDNEIRCAKMFSFPYFLKDSSVVSLKLEDCNLSDKIGVKLMKSFKFSKLTKLDVSSNHLTNKSLVAFAQIVKDTDITHFNFCYNGPDKCCDLDKAFISFGELMVGSKLKYIDITYGNFQACEGHQPLGLTVFLEKIKYSSVKYLNLQLLRFSADGVKMILPHLLNLQLTELNLSGNWLFEDSQSLAANVKFNAITHLNLSLTNLRDRGVEALAKCLPDMSVVDLDLTRNGITCPGAIALAHSLYKSNIVSLKLNENGIGSNGLEVLAKYAKSSLVSVIEVRYNPGNRFPLETVIWNNRRIVNQLKPLVVSLFERIAPKTGDKFLRFEHAASSTNVDVFLEECLTFYKTVSEQALTVRVLAREENVLLSRDQISDLLDDFPQQFVMFVASKIEGETLEHVRLLKRAEELEVDRIVELLLLNRPLYTIDELHGILHSYAYELLNKYKLPLCNLDIEPKGIEKIIKYFTMFNSIEGAADVIKMLQNIRPS